MARLAVGEMESNASVVSKEERVVASKNKLVGSHTCSHGRLLPILALYLFVCTTTSSTVSVIQYTRHLLQYLTSYVLYRNAVFLPVQIIIRFQFTTRPSLAYSHTDCKRTVSLREHLEYFT